MPNTALFLILDIHAPAGSTTWWLSEAEATAVFQSTRPQRAQLGG